MISKKMVLKLSDCLSKIDFTIVKLKNTSYEN